MLPHFLYGPGEDALLLTKEHGAKPQGASNASVIPDKHKKFLCLARENRGTDCEVDDVNFAPQVLLFIAQLVSGVGGSLYYTLGVSYMDDNIQKSKTPALISFSYFLRMLGPAIGYGLASFALKFYISPTLTPTITTQDPRYARHRFPRRIVSQPNRRSMIKAAYRRCDSRRDRAVGLLGAQYGGLTRF